MAHGPAALVARCTRYLSIVAPPLLEGASQVSLTVVLPGVATGERGAVAAIAAAGVAIAAGGVVVGGTVVVAITAGGAVVGGVVVVVAIAAGGVVVVGGVGAGDAGVVEVGAAASSSVAGDDARIGWHVSGRHRRIVLGRRRRRAGRGVVAGDGARRRIVGRRAGWDVGGRRVLGDTGIGVVAPTAPAVAATEVATATMRMARRTRFEKFMICFLVRQGIPWLPLRGA